LYARLRFSAILLLVQESVETLKGSGPTVSCFPAAQCRPVFVSASIVRTFRADASAYAGPADDEVNRCVPACAGGRDTFQLHLGQRAAVCLQSSSGWGRVRTSAIDQCEISRHKEGGDPLPAGVVVTRRRPGSSELAASRPVPKPRRTAIIVFGGLPLILPAPHRASAISQREVG
jgi:hypothetical protein